MKSWGYIINWFSKRFCPSNLLPKLKWGKLQEIKLNFYYKMFLKTRSIVFRLLCSLSSAVKIWEFDIFDKALYNWPWQKTGFFKVYSHCGELPSLVLMNVRANASFIKIWRLIQLTGRNWLISVAISMPEINTMSSSTANTELPRFYFNQFVSGSTFYTNSEIVVRNFKKNNWTYKSIN